MAGHWDKFSLVARPTHQLLHLFFLRFWVNVSFHASRTVSSAGQRQGSRGPGLLPKYLSQKTFSSSLLNYGSLHERRNI